MFERHTYMCINATFSPTLKDVSECKHNKLIKEKKMKTCTSIHPFQTFRLGIFVSTLELPKR
jgi:hypothetical protein